MKLSEWTKLRKNRGSTPELTERERQIGLSENPGDFYFAVKVDPAYSTRYIDGQFVEEPRTMAIICPRKYFDEKGHVYDGHVLGYVNVPGFAEDMECYISPSASMPELEPAEMHELLLDIGLVWSKKFADFCNSHDPGYDNAYYPDNA